MSIKAMTWAWGLAELPLRESMVLLALADNANDEGYCWPSQETIAVKSRGSVRTVKRAVAFLQDAGLVEVQRRGSQSGRRSNMYRLLVGVDYVPVESGEGVVEDAEFSLGNKQRANLALSENEDRAEPVDNSGLPTEISKGPNWHLADGESSLSATGGPLQGDMGGTLLPLIGNPNIESPIQSRSIDEAEAGRSASSPVESGGDVDWELIRKCLPEQLRVFDGLTARTITGLLRDRVAAGWLPSQILRVIESHRFPASITNAGGLAIHRISKIAPEGAPSRPVSPEVVSVASPVVEEPVGPSIDDLPVDQQPGWFRAMKAEQEAGGPNADKPFGFWVKQAFKEQGKVR